MSKKCVCSCGDLCRVNEISLIPYSNVRSLNCLQTTPRNTNSSITIVPILYPSTMFYLLSLTLSLSTDSLNPDVKLILKGNSKVLILIVQEHPHIIGLSFFLILGWLFVFLRKKLQGQTHMFPDITPPCLSARPPATVITSNQNKLTGSLGWEKKKLIFRFQGQPVRSEWKSRQSCREAPWRKECGQPSEHWDRFIMKHYVPQRPIPARSQPCLAAEVLKDFLHNCILLWKGSEGVGVQ